MKAPMVIDQQAAAPEFDRVVGETGESEEVRRYREAVQRSRGSDVDTLWSEYKRTGDRRLRDHLIVRYSPLVKFVAGRVSSGLPRTIEQSDLISYGMFGLIDAIDKFDTGRSIKFETYAITRI